MLRVLLLAIVVITVVSLLPVESTQPSAFADPAFSRYQRLAGAQGRALLWGGDPLIAVVEPYIGAPGNRRLVEYYERGRMEIVGVDPGAVTEGLLVREMVSGTVQQGADVVVQEPAADAPILGGASVERADAPTYADFTTLTAPRLAGPGDVVFDTWIDGDGNLSEREPPVPITSGRYVSETGHTLPDVFTAWEQSEPFGAIDTLRALGYPITEPYWITTGLGEAGVSLIQLFERRVVVYTPDLPVGERFSLTDVGRHYYRWRYGVDPRPFQAAENRSILPTESNDSGLTLPEDFRVSALPIDVDGIVDIAVAPNGDLALAYSNGTIRITTAEGQESGGDPFREGLLDPVAIAFSGTDLYVSDADGLHRLRDANGDRVVDNERTVSMGELEPESVTLVAGLEETLYVSGVRRETPQLGQATTAAFRSLIRFDADGSMTELTNLDADMRQPMVVDTNDMLWLLDANNQLMMLDPSAERATPMLDARTIGSIGGLSELLVYRPDGAVGDPREDLLALVHHNDGGQIIRVRPASQVAAPGTHSNSSDGTPDTGSQPGAVVDYVTGFERPTAMAAGIDGSLYVLDAAKGSIFRIQPG